MADSEKLAEDLFEAALAHPPDERTAWLDRACPESPELRELVRMLLRADERAGDFLESPLLSNSDASTEQAAPILEPGTTVAARFQIHRFIARGGMGDVYEAWDSELRERVAIKTIRPDLAQRPQVIDRFRREVKQARAISHPNVCRIHELFCDVSPSAGKVWFLSMEFLDGFTLSEHIRHIGPIKPALAFNLLEQIVSGLNALHAIGIIHRDLKSGNIMLVSGTVGDLRAVITDFGLATNVLRPEAGLLERGGQGTPEYMAPEQRTSADVTALADQYALGVILCEMLTGCRPTKSEVTSARPQFEAKLAKTIDSHRARVILRCLEQTPERRFKTLNEIVLALKPAEPRTRLWIATAAAIVLLIAAGAFWLRPKPAAPSTSLAVLPLVNRTGNANLDYLGAGITEALTDDLSRMPGLQVAAGTVARHYHGADTDPRSAGANMQVGSIVSGSFQSSGDKLQIPIELVEVRSGKQIWGQTYSGTTSDLADMQHEIATDVAYHLKIHLSPEAAARLKRQYSTNPAAYDAYLQGRFQFAKRTPDGLRQAVTDFQRAQTSDPQYAPALAGLADCYSLLAFYGLETPIPLLKNALKTSQQALELDSTSAEAYSARALARTLLNFDWQGAEDDYKRAINLDPKYLQAHTSYALLLLAPQGRLAEARAQLAYAQAADPDSPLSIVGQAMLEEYAGNYNKSIQILEPSVHELNRVEPTVQNLAIDYIAEHQARKAIEILNTPVSPDLSDSRQALLGVAYASAGETSKAQEVAKQVELHRRQGSPIAYDSALLYAALKDRNRALDTLYVAFETREPDIIWSNVDPLLVSLRSEQKFHSLIAEMNLQ